MSATFVSFAPRRLTLLLSLAVACGVPVDLGGTSSTASTDVGTTCASFAGPETTAPCSGCTTGSSGCQPNGCFNGYFCDISERDCKTPGTPCSTTGKFDSH